MNKSITILTIATIALFGIFAGCKKKENTKLSANVDSLVFEIGEERKSFGVISNAEWIITEVPNWLDVDPLSGRGNGAVTVTAESYSSTEERNATLSITVRGLSPVQVTVSQLGIPRVEVGEQSAVMVQGTAVTVAFSVTARNIIDGTHQFSVQGLPEGVFTQGTEITISEGKGTLSLRNTAEAEAGSYLLNLTMGETTSASFLLDIGSKPPDKLILTVLPIGSLQQGVAGSMAFLGAVQGIANGIYHNPIFQNLPTGVTADSAVVANVGGAGGSLMTFGLRGGTNTVAGTYNNLRVSIDGSPMSDPFTLTIRHPTIVKTVAVGAPTGTLNAGVAGTIRYSVTTTNIANGTYTATLSTNRPGISVQGSVTINNNSGTLTIAGNTTTVPTTNDTRANRISIDNTLSNEFNIVVNQNPAALAISATTPLNFGSVKMGYSRIASQPVTITNIGTQTVTLVTHSSMPNYEVTGFQAMTTLAPGASKRIHVYPKDNLKTGNYNTTLNITASITLPETATAQVNLTFSVTQLFAGEGTEASPYLIGSLANIQELKDVINRGAAVFAAEGIHYRQTTNITIPASANWGTIGASDIFPFRGNYNGNGFTVNLTMNNTLNHRGLFGNVNGGTIRNLIVNANITGGHNTGAIVGALRGTSADRRGIVMNCMVYGTVNGQANTGGIVGNIRTWGRVINSFSMATVTGTEQVGGIAGRLGSVQASLNGNGSIFDSYATGAITGTSAVGGIVGRVEVNNSTEINAALNPSVNGQQAGAAIGVFDGTRRGELVLRGMLVNGVAVTSNGTGFRVITLEQARTQNTYYYTWGSGNTETRRWVFGTTEARPWVMGNTSSWNLPFLHYQTSPPGNQALPTHLR